MAIRQNVTWAIVVVFLTAGSISAAVAAERAPLQEKFPETVEVIPAIEDFPLLKNLLELNDPWKEDLPVLKEQIFPRKMEFPPNGVMATVGLATRPKTC